MNDFLTDKKWSDEFMPEIKSIIGRHLVKIAPDSDDMNKNTDLIMPFLRIPVRVRRDNLSRIKLYGDEFTIRCKRENKKTEIHKLVEGYGDYFFYGWASGGDLVKWSIIDLNVLRLEIYRNMLKNGGDVPAKYQPNHDGKTAFFIFNFADFPASMVVASSKEAK